MDIKSRICVKYSLLSTNNPRKINNVMNFLLTRTIL